MAKIIRVWDGTQWQEVGTALPNALSTDGVQTLTNKTINLTSNTLTGTTAQFNTALSDGNFTTLAGTETLTNKTISGVDNTLTNIPNNALTNSSITINGSAVSLGGSTTISTLPTQTSNSGKYLTTDGSSASWSDVTRIVPPDSSISVPGAPTSVSAMGEDTQSTVSFVAPTNNGGSTILGYTVISSPGNIKKSGSSSPITVTGLTNGTAYTFTVKAHNIAGSSVASSASSSVTPAPTIAVDFLVLAGGGGSGWRTDGLYYHGGGGGGGLRSSVDGNGGGASSESVLLLSKGSTYTVTVGAGGAGGVTGSGGGSAGSNGADSYISGNNVTLTATGGGRGGIPDGNGANGGSGGGGGGNDISTTGGSAVTPIQGYAGGNSTNLSGDPGSGGGGAGGAGQSANNSTSKGGTGGSAKQNSITGASVYYAGGGPGGGGYPGPSLGDTGTGYTHAANLGMGGYITSPTSNSVNSGNSGLVVIRSTEAAVSTTGSPTYTTSGSYHIYKFTGSGSITYQ